MGWRGTVCRGWTRFSATTWAPRTPRTRARLLAGRVLDPGINAVMVLVPVGPQGAGKFTVVAALAPSEEQLIELGLGVVGQCAKVDTGGAKYQAEAAGPIR